MRTKIQGGWFQTDPFHAYFADDNQWIPSATQCLKLCGLSDYHGVNEDVMANAAERGTLVHDLVFAQNKYGEIDPSWLTDEVSGYFDGYCRFLKETGFTPNPDWIETGIIGSICGMKIGLTPDVFGQMKREPWLIEVKAASAVQASWSIQTGLQELAIHKSNHVGRVRRFALQLFKDGRYKLHPHTNHQEDELIAIAALRMVWWRLNHGQKVWELV